jgi:hypothetical protein
MVRVLFRLGIFTLAAFPIGVAVAGLVLGVEAVPELLRYIAISAGILFLGPLVEWTLDTRHRHRPSRGTSEPEPAGRPLDVMDPNRVGLELLGQLREVETALGPEHPKVLALQDLFVMFLYQTGREMEALIAARLYVEIRSRRLGPGHPHTVRARRLLTAMATDEEQALNQVFNDIR